jgi:hypothetical protein
MTLAHPAPNYAPLDARVIDRAVVSAVAYSDVFEYPLRDFEVHRYLHAVPAGAVETAAALARCSAPGGALTQRNGYYTLRGRERLVEVRRARAAHAARLWPAALRFGHAIGGVPFVRMVAVTGSLAWNNPDHSGDVDYLIVTEPDRLWICRWLVQAIAHTARFDGVRLCANYVVSTRALLLGEHNLYGAYEVARMTPIVGLGMYRRLRRANPWVTAYLPNAIEPPPPPGPPEVPVRSAGKFRRRVVARLKRLGERVLSARAAAALERYEMRYRIRKRLKHGVAEAAYDRDRHKGHWDGHRQRALTEFAERLRRLEEGSPSGIA